MIFYAHSENAANAKEKVSDHLRETAKLACKFASVWGRSEEAKAAGLLHDLGKYTELFQKVLNREQVKVDHATPGALAALKKYKNQGIAIALAIQGHHDGLVCGIPGELQASVLMKDAQSPTGKTFSSRDVDSLLQHLEKDNLKLPVEIESDYVKEYVNNHQVAAMLYTRMLFSALVDADFLSTEAHFNGDENGYIYRPMGEKLEADSLLTKLLKHIEQLRHNSTAHNKIRSLRDDLFNACLLAGEMERGVYTLTAPTGTGKTLAMLAFALKHALVHSLRRIIIVLPYLSIIEQNAEVYRKVIEESGKSGLVLEDHSLAELPESQRLLAENWDAPIIVTTTVRFFEGLFANQSVPCRRLHNIAKSIILFDEAQTMPPELVSVTLASLSYLVERFGCTVVFSTATQPAFGKFHEKVKVYTASGWQPKELIPQSLQLFQRARRVKINWLGSLDWEQLANEIVSKPQVLVIVNTRKHAKILYQMISSLAADQNTMHISTDMCPAHRLDTIFAIKSKLFKGDVCRVISTQCVEAGVDIDFPIVWRALAPLEAICQAAGRCNREGKLQLGEVNVFIPPLSDEKYPSLFYKKAAIEVKMMLKEKGHLDIDDPNTIREYYERYFQQNLEQCEEKELLDAIKSIDFYLTSKHYNWIKEKTNNVLVPYLPRIELYEELCDQARNGGFGRSWIKRAQQISVGHRVNPKSPIWDVVEPVMDKNKQDTGWYILLDKNVYSRDVGLNPKDISEIYFA